jgi:hypothetical protein
MKPYLKYVLISLALFSFYGAYSQVGIGTKTPEESSILDVASTSKGLLIPRLTTAERNNITLPATGLMIFNVTENDGEFNVGTPSTPSWIGTKRPIKPMIYSVTEGTVVSTESASNSLITGMTLSCAPGTYMATFNAQHTGKESQAFSSSSGVLDLVEIYDDLIGFPGGVSHAVTFGSGEILSPGVYDVAGAASISGTLTLDGGGDSSSVFIIRCTGAFSAAANSTVILQGDAEARNVFWVATGTSSALTVSEYSSIKGNLVSNSGAISMAANTSLKGRMFTKTGAVSVGANSVLTIPSGDSPIDLGIISSFVMFSTNGAITSDGTSIVNGDLGNASGAITIAGDHYGESFPAGTQSIVGTKGTTYSIYQNGVEITNSSRIINSLSTVVSLQTLVTLTEQRDIEVRWKVDAGEAILDNRVLSLVRSEN